jgi:hypothetical protein
MILSNEKHWNNEEYIYSTYLQSLVVQCRYNWNIVESGVKHYKPINKKSINTED